MRLVRATVLLGLTVGFILAIAGCDKEKIVNSTVRDTQYIQLPPDTVFVADTVINHVTDTVHIVDTVNSSVTVHDTVHVTDTVVTVLNHYDTVTVVQHHYDTVTVVQNHHDTVTIAQCNASSAAAVKAMERKTDPMVYDMISQEFGIDGGWVFYLSQDQMDIQQASANVFDIYAYIDYWTDDWSGYYPLETYWRLTFNGGDPANPDNWTMGDPPTSAHPSGVRITNKSVQIETNPR